MNKPIGHIIVLTAIAAMLLPSVYSNLLQLERFIAKIIAHEKIETEQLTTIRIPVSEAKWYEEGKELEVNNQLFDVESFVIRNDTMIITGITDTLETEIDLAVNKLVHTEGFEELLKNIAENILDFTAFKPTSLAYQMIIDSFEESPTDRYCIKHLANIYRAIQTPPPDTFS